MYIKGRVDVYSIGDLMSISLCGGVVWRRVTLRG